MNPNNSEREITNANVPRTAFIVVAAVILGLAYLLSGCTAANRLTPEEIAAYQSVIRGGIQDYKTIKAIK